MIPDFDLTTGFLPIGIHNATWQELEAKYGYTEHRRDLLKGLFAAVQDLRSCGCRLIYVDGGFIVNKKLPPKDIDVCWDKAGVNLADLKIRHKIFFDPTPGRKLQKLKYKCEFFPADMIEGKTGKPFLNFFQQNNGIPKGIIRINIENI